MLLTRIEHFADLPKGTTLLIGNLKRTMSLISYPAIQSTNGVIERVKLKLCDDIGQFDELMVERNKVHTLPKIELSL